MRRYALSGLAAAILAACSGGGATIGAGSPSAPTAPGTGPSTSPSMSPTMSPSPAPTGSLANGKIKHIVVILQENRSFDNLFHGFSEPSGAKADYADFGYDKAGNKIALVSQPIEGESGGGNDHPDFIADYDGGKMDGFFDHNAGSIPPSANGNNGLSYVPQTEVQPYWDMATQGALGERFFHGVTGSTEASHMVFAAGSSTWDGNPNQRVTGNNGSAWGCVDTMGDTLITYNSDGSQGPSVPTCIVGVSTLEDMLDQAHVSWRWYSPYIAPPMNGKGGGAASVGGYLNPMMAYSQIYFGPDFPSNVVSPETRVLADVPAGTLADVTWVTPAIANSDHPLLSASSGPQWVANVVNAIGGSSFWNSTAIFVTWDDWGGFYDHVPPPQKYGVFGPGFRIPLIAISPYAKHGQLVDTQLEPGSILKFIEETFGAASLGREDATSNSASVMFDFTQTPGSFKTVTSARSRAYFLRQRPSGMPVDTDMQGPGHPAR